MVGNLGKDPEVRTTQAGQKIVSFSLATSEPWNDKGGGERKERTTWHNVVVMNERLAELAEKYLRKGRKAYVEGSIQSRKFTDRSDNERTVTEIVLDRFRGELVLLDGARAAETIEDVSRRAPAASRAPVGRARAAAAPAWEPQDDLNDEIPF